MDWLANRDLPRAALETMLTAQMVALLQVAATRDRELSDLARTNCSPTRAGNQQA